MSYELQDLYEAMKAAAMGAQRNPMEFGHIASYDGKDSVMVYFPHDTSTVHGPYQLMGMGAGNGWGLQFAPLGGGLDANGNPTGEQCMVLFPDPAHQIGFCQLGTWNNVNKSPGVPGGEFWVVHKSGSTMKLTNDGNAQITGANVLLGGSDAASSGDNAVLRLGDLKTYHNNYVAIHTHGTAFGTSTSPLMSFIGWMASKISFSK